MFDSSTHLLMSPSSLVHNVDEWLGGGCWPNLFLPEEHLFQLSRSCKPPPFLCVCMPDCTVSRKTHTYLHTAPRYLPVNCRWNSGVPALGIPIAHHSIWPCMLRGI